MKSFPQKLLLVGIFYLLSAKPAFAYLDPGTGSYVLQLLLGGLFGLLYLIKMRWRKIKHIILNILTRLNGNKEK